MDNKKIEPIKHSDFGLTEHRYRTFDTNVPGGYDQKDLENPDLWVHLAPQLNVGDEVRVIADDGTFYARLLVIFTKGSIVKTKLIYGTDLEKIDTSLETTAEIDYEIKQRGQKKWCVMKKSTGEVVEELIPTQAEAMRAMDDLLKALKS